MSSAKTVINKILKISITNRNGTVCANAIKKLKINSLLLTYIEHRTRQWDCLSPTMNDRVNILIQYNLSPEKCPVCGKPRFSWKKFCSVGCANICQKRPVKHPSEKFNEKIKKEKNIVKLMCDNKPICWLATRDRITFAQYATRTSNVDEFFCFLDGSVVSKFQLRSINTIELLRNTPSPDPKYTSKSSYRNRNRKGQTTVHKPTPIPEHFFNIGSVEDYYRLAWKYTDLSLKTNPIDAQHMRSTDFHIDHIFSISDGIVNKIHPAVIGNSVNLRVLDAKSNCSKGARSDISKEDLFAKYERVNGITVPTFDDTYQLTKHLAKSPSGPVQFGYVKDMLTYCIDPLYKDAILDAYNHRKQGKTLVFCAKLLVSAGMQEVTAAKVRSLFYRIARDNNEIAHFKATVDRPFKNTRIVT